MPIIDAYKKFRENDTYSTNMWFYYNEEVWVGSRKEKNTSVIMDLAFKRMVVVK